MQFSVKIRPSSSKSFFEIHILLNALRDEIVDAPHQHEMCLFAGAIKVTFTFFGKSYYICLCNLWQNVFIIVVLPATTIALLSGYLRSMSQALMHVVTSSWIPGYSSPIKEGLKRISGALDFSAFPRTILVPSGSRYSFWFYVLIALSLSCLSPTFPMCDKSESNFLLCSST